MRRSFERVGVARRALALIPEIVRICRVCHEWAKPGRGNVCNIELVGNFNEQVDCGLLYRCIIWQAAMLIPSKEE
eukprot:6745103-Lingulodinium_polyedra.AAC.1